MSRFIAILALFLVAVSAVDLTGYKVYDVNSQQDNHIYLIPNGQKFALRLPSNPTTGYDWVLSNLDELKSQNLLSTLSLNEGNRGEYESDPAPAGMTGVGGHSYFKFQGNGNGQGLVMVGLQYKRPWETDSIRSIGVAIDLQ